MEESSEPNSWWLLTLLPHLSFSVFIATTILFVFLVFSAFISGAEVAFFSFSPNEIKKIKKSPSKANRKIIQLINSPKELLATILISNNFINVAIVIISTFITTNLYDFSLNPTVKFIIQVLLVTFLILLFGEIIPKVYATKYPIKVATIMAYPLLFLKKGLTPFSRLLINTTSIIDKKIKKKENIISLDELSHALELTTNETTDDEEHKILKGIVKFGNTDVKQIMTARTNIIALDNKINYLDLLKSIIESGYSRIPIFKENFDKVIGIIYIKDLLSHLKKGNTFKWQSLIRPPYFVPENKKINDLLKEFQEKKIHLAIVVDEYGGTSGIITLEDIIEEIVGEITDEFDNEDKIYSQLDDNNFIFEGKTQLNDFYRIIGIDGNTFESAKGESDTLAGFILELAGKIPHVKEQITFKKYIFTIEAADKRKIKKIKLTIQQ